MSFIASWIFAVLLVVSLQSTATHYMSFYGIRLDLVMVFVVFTGAFYGKKYGLMIGFFCGLIVDLLNMGLFGFHIFYFLTIGYFSGLLQKKFFEDNYIMPFLLVGIFTFAGQLIWYICLLLASYNLTNFSMIIFTIFVKVLFNTIITLPIFFLFEKAKKIFG